MSIPAEIRATPRVQMLRLPPLRRYARCLNKARPPQARRAFLSLPDLLATRDKGPARWSGFREQRVFAHAAVNAGTRMDALLAATRKVPVVLTTLHCADSARALRGALAAPQHV